MSMKNPYKLLQSMLVKLLTENGAVSFIELARGSFEKRAIREEPLFGNEAVDFSVPMRSYELLMDMSKFDGNRERLKEKILNEAPFCVEPPILIQWRTFCQYLFCSKAPKKYVVGALTPLFEMYAQISTESVDNNNAYFLGRRFGQTMSHDVRAILEIAVQRSKTGAAVLRETGTSADKSKQGLRAQLKNTNERIQWFSDAIQDLANLLGWHLIK